MPTTHTIEFYIYYRGRNDQWGETTSGAKRLGEETTRGEMLGGETTREGNGLGAKLPGFTRTASFRGV